MHDCPATVEDIEVAKDIFGKDIHALKGKTTRQAPFAVTSDYTETPQEILQLHNDIAIGMDFMFINGIIFHVTASSKIEFCAIEDVPNESVKGALESFKAVVKLHNKRELAWQQHWETMNLTHCKLFWKKNATHNATQPVQMNTLLKWKG